MRAVNRWLVALVWMLSLALPLQGLAASLPAVPMSTPHGGAEALSPAPQAHPCHEAAADEPAAITAGCATCAACHAASAPAPRVPRVAGAAAAAGALPDWRAPAEPAVRPSGLDRPPRSALA